MRKGSKTNPWTTSEISYLMESAGRVPRREICQHLRRSTDSVKSMAKRLRREGRAIDLRCHVTSLSPCPFCGNLSGLLDRHGVCEPCRRREQLARIHSRISDLLPLLPERERGIYDKTESETASRLDPRPSPPDTAGLSYYKRARAEEAHALALEEWVARNLRRQVKAAQKRKERIEKKVIDMGKPAIGEANE